MMKKKYSLKYLLALAGLIVSPTIALANPVGVTVDVYCPNTQGSPNVITNFGDYIAGFGMESILSQNNSVYFKSISLPSDMPNQLTNYYNEAVNYNSVTGRVSCSYISNTPTDPRFVVSYTLTNGRGGAVQWQSGNAININFPVGMKG